MNPKKAETALRILHKRAQVQTEVELGDGTKILAVNVSWSRDRGEDYDYVVVFPETEGPGTAFYTSEIARLIDPHDGRVIWSVA